MKIKEIFKEVSEMSNRKGENFLIRKGFEIDYSISYMPKEYITFYKHSDFEDYRIDNNRTRKTWHLINDKTGEHIL